VDMELRHLRYFVAAAEAGSLGCSGAETAQVAAFVESADSRS
jgi:hypothetical protein